MFTIILFYCFIAIIAMPNDIFKSAEYKINLEIEELEYFEFYNKFLSENTDKDYLRKLSLFSHIRNLKMFIEEIAGKNCDFEKEDDENMRAYKIFSSFKDYENEENDNSWTEEFKQEFIKFTENSLEMAKRFLENFDFWNFEKKFCEIYKFVYFWIKNEKLLKNKFWIDILDLLKYLPKYVIFK